MSETRTCEMEGCTARYRSLGLCRAHRVLLTDAEAATRKVAREVRNTPQPARVLKNQSRKGLLCSTGCGRDVHARGFCHSCYKMHAPRKPCGTDGCPGRMHAQGLCSSCYGKAMTRGKRGASEGISVVRPVGIPAETRFSDNVRMDRGCRVWSGFVDNTGMGRFTPERGQSVQVHRWAYEREVAPIPADEKTGKTMHVDHNCRVPRCSRVSHLEPVTPSENARRGRVAAGTEVITERDMGWFWTALRAFTNGHKNFPASVVTKTSRVTVFVVDKGVAA